ncbi:MAG: hypothetical protein DHS20C15_17840 [Planctomycetota bacterium]|nr:MAG: hypothetical protein DHS20C15_17840 [Planctomycetota bacterium]
MLDKEGVNPSDESLEPMTDWMAALADHNARLRQQHPNEELIVVFDIDGTILDMRHMVRHVLLAYDRAHRTRAFAGLSVDDIDVHENRVGELLARLGLPEVAQQHVLGWYLDRRWSPEAVRAAHRPFRGVLDVIRWFQMQPNTRVALNSGRPESLREETLRCLNELGADSRVRFESELLMLDAQPLRKDPGRAKLEGLRTLRARGARVLAVIDNEPEVLESLRDADDTGDMLFLHAHTLFESRHSSASSVSGERYDLLSLADRRPLPGHLSLVWEGLESRDTLQAFLEAPVRWGAAPLRLDPSGRLVVRADDYDTRAWSRSERALEPRELVAELADAGKCLRVELTEGGELVDRALDLLERSGLPAERLAFHASIEQLGPAGFRHLRWAFPESTLQMPADFLAPLALSVPERARDLLDMFASWGVSRYQLDWATAQLPALIGFFEADTREVDLRGVPDLESFLRAALLQPHSLTADFRFPQWCEGELLRADERLLQLRELVPACASA